MDRRLRSGVSRLRLPIELAPVSGAARLFAVLQCLLNVLLPGMTYDAIDRSYRDFTGTILDFTLVPLERNRAHGWTPLTQRSFLPFTVPSTT